MLIFILLLKFVNTLDNGLAKTPPMGWLAWERFRCQVDCEADRQNCLDENLIKQHADILSQPEWKSAGYEYINVDDCWSNLERDSDGQLSGNATRFPSGIQHLAEYLHERGLKFGIYNDMGTKTCGSYPGECKDKLCTLPGYMDVDAKTYANWGIDSLKMDGCNSNWTREVLDRGYIFLGDQLNKTGRPILYSCSWSRYIYLAHLKVDYVKIAEHCNLWRVYEDIQDSYDSVMNIADWIGDNGGPDGFLNVAGPGKWNDPDMLIIGNFGLSYEQSKTQMALWSIMAAPLFMGNDLRNLDPKFKEILLAQEVIDVNQDVLGKQGYRIAHEINTLCGAHDIWMRKLFNGDIAVVLWARGVCGNHLQLTVQFKDLGLDKNATMKVRDLFAQKDLGIFKGSFTSWVNLSGVVMVRLSTSE